MNKIVCHDGEHAVVKKLSTDVTLTYLVTLTSNE